MLFSYLRSLSKRTSHAVRSDPRRKRRANNRKPSRMALGFQPLESRIAPTGDPVVFVQGAEDVQQWAEYELQLIAPEDLNVTGWTIDWGDGSNPDGGDPGEDFSADTSLATHTYVAGGAVNITRRGRN